MVDFKVADGVIPENFEHFDRMCDNIRETLTADLDRLTKLSPDELRDGRYKRFRRFGEFDK